MSKKEIAKQFLAMRNAEAFTGINEQVLRKLFDQGVIEGYKIPSGQRMFSIRSLEKFCGMSEGGTCKQTKVSYVYTRVSSKKQLDDLERQADFLRNYDDRYTDYIIIKDIGSGINFKRKGLQEILERCMQGCIGNVVVAHRDRLSRFGFDLIKIIIEKAGGTLTVINDSGNGSTEQELAEDLLSIVHIYSCRQMGKRRYSNKPNNTNQNILEDETKINSESENSNR